MKDVEDELKIVIVCDMWLTGFDVPCLHTMYVDKPMSGHNLMQAIARVNRVFKDKPGGLIVDYIGIADNLRSALAQYTPSDRKTTGIDPQVAIDLMLEKYEQIQGILHGLDYSSYISGSASERMACIVSGVDVYKRQRLPLRLPAMPPASCGIPLFRCHTCRLFWPLRRSWW